MQLWKLYKICRGRMMVQHECHVEACMVYHQFQAFEIPVEMSELPGRTQSLKQNKSKKNIIKGKGEWKIGQIRLTLCKFTDLLPIKTIHFAASTIVGFQGDKTNRQQVSVKAITPKIIKTSVASHSWGSSGVMHTSGCPSDFWHMTVKPSRTEPATFNN